MMRGHAAAASFLLFLLAAAFPAVRAIHLEYVLQRAVYFFFFDDCLYGLLLVIVLSRAEIVIRSDDNENKRNDHNK